MHLPPLTSAALPVTGAWQPDRDEARRLMEEELARDRYQAAQPNPVAGWLMDRLEEFVEWLDSLGQGAAGVPGWILLLGLLAVAAVILVLVRPRANSRGRRREGTVLPDRVLSPADHRAAAERAWAHDDHGGALVSWFRAAVREAEVRTLLDERPGRTATEAAAELGQHAPAEHAALRAVADRFNAVLYDHATATADQAAQARDLDRRLAAAAAPASDLLPAAGVR